MPNGIWIWTPNWNRLDSNVLNPIGVCIFGLRTQNVLSSPPVSTIYSLCPPRWLSQTQLWTHNANYMRLLTTENLPSIWVAKSNMTEQIRQSNWVNSHTPYPSYGNLVSTPLDPGMRLSPCTKLLLTEEEEKVKVFPYYAIIGKAIYLNTCTCPNIAYTVRELTRFMSNYGPAHIAAAKHLPRYLQEMTTASH